MCKLVSETLTAVVYDPRYSDENIRRVIAKTIQRSEATVSRILSEDATMDQNQSAALSRLLCDRYNDRRLAECFVGSTCAVVPIEGTANGRYEDELRDATVAIAEWVKAMEAGDSRLAGAAVDAMSQVVHNMRQEVARL